MSMDIAALGKMKIKPATPRVTEIFESNRRNLNTERISRTMNNVRAENKSANSYPSNTPDDDLEELKEFAGATWPDPPPRKHHRPMVDDVSRLNATEVESLVFVRCEADIVNVLALAKEEGKQVSIRGTQHSMGGHTIAPRGIVIDMRHINHTQYNVEEGSVTVGCGAHWTHLIQYLNQYGLSPRTMQSYSSFSVGGTLSVNAHGITTDYCLCESVLRFTLFTAEGDRIVCTRVAPEGSKERELFGLAIGGYGMFGVISEVTMSVNNNVPLHLDLVQVTSEEFPRIYEAILKESECYKKKDIGDEGKAKEREELPWRCDVEVKLARLDITNLSHMEVYIFRRATLYPHSYSKTISPLPLQPRTMSLTSRFIYKWLAPTLQELRFSVERSLGRAFDWGEANDRNELMYESAIPLAQLYSPLLQIDDTFILQEYFVPRARFLKWVTLAKPIYQAIGAHSSVHLLNTTVRFVYQDCETAMPYATSVGGSYAFVLYYRISRTTEGDAALAAFHHQFTEVTLLLGGCFYLPYRHHYTDEQLVRAYGLSTLQHFMSKKELYDPECRFSSLWLRSYGVQYASKEYGARVLRQGTILNMKNKEKMKGKKKESEKVNEREKARMKTTPGSVIQTTPPPPRNVSEQRTDSFRRLFHNSRMRQQFLEEFLQRVFHAEDPNVLYRLLSRAVWDPCNESDIDIYTYVREQLQSNSGTLRTAVKLWNTLKQVHAQKVELTEEVVGIVSRLGKLGTLHQYVSIGDHGKLTIPLREALGMRGRTYVVHDKGGESESEDVELSVVLERGSVESYGEYIPIDYNDVSTPPLPISAQSVDLVTMMQGLHHLPQSEIIPLLSEVWRVLREGGLFIVREHDAKGGEEVGTTTNKGTTTFKDATTDKGFTYQKKGNEKHDSIIPMLDVAHSVFNAVTGVPVHEERHEIRAFRSVLEWREIIESVGFVDTMLYASQQDDPTCDEMMCFVKPYARSIASASATFSNESARLEAIPPNPKPPPILPHLSALSSTMPANLLTLLHSTLTSILSALPTLQSTLTQFITANTTAGMASVATQTITLLFNNVKLYLQRFRPLLESSHSNTDLNLDLLPPELFLILPTLEKKVKRGTASPFEMIVTSQLHDVISYLSMQGMEDVEGEEGDDHDDESEGGEGVDIVESRGSVGLTVNIVAQKLTALLHHIPVLADVDALSRKHLLLSPIAERALKSIWVSTPTSSTISTTSTTYNTSTTLSTSTTSQNTLSFRKSLPHHDDKISPKILPLSQWIVRNIDEISWVELEVVLSSLLKHPAPPPSLQLLLDTINSPHITLFTENTASPHVTRSPITLTLWSRVLMIVLSSPKVHITPTMAFQARILGLKGLYDAWRYAQRLRESAATNDGSSEGGIDSDVPNLRLHKRGIPPALHKAIGQFTETSTRQSEVVMSEGKFRDVHNVLEVVSATYGYTSLTARPLDVLEIVRERLEGNTLKLRGFSLSNYSTRTGASLDFIRKTVTFNTSQLKLVIKPVLETDPAHKHKVAALCTQLLKAGWTKPLHVGDGHLTWFKLPEWMQVEMVQIFGESMNHTPWYRFPFMSFIKTYFSVLMQEVGVVAAEYDVSTALLSNAFITDLVPGLLMLALFAQLQLLALPLKSVLGESYSMEESMVEEVVIHTGNVSVAQLRDTLAEEGMDEEDGSRGESYNYSNSSRKTSKTRKPPNHSSTTTTIPWKLIDKSIIQAKQVLPTEHLYVLTLPTFKPFTSILCKLAHYLPSAEILEVSNQQIVQVKVVLTGVVGEEEERRVLKEYERMVGCEVMFSFRYPVDGKSQHSPLATDTFKKHSSSSSSSVPLSVSLRVSVLSLLKVILLTGRLKVTLKQIYDFYC